jgi:hypothetical protein
MRDAAQDEIVIQMTKRFPTLICAAAMLVAPIVVDARPPDREQDAALEGSREGRILPLRTIENRVIPKMRGATYLGPELDPGTGRYRLKFMRGTQVIWVDVDGRTGQIVGKTGG